MRTRDEPKLILLVSQENAMAMYVNAATITHLEPQPDMPGTIIHFSSGGTVAVVEDVRDIVAACGGAAHAGPGTRVRRDDPA